MLPQVLAYIVSLVASSIKLGLIVFAAGYLLTLLVSLIKVCLLKTRGKAHPNRAIRAGCRSTLANLPEARDQMVACAETQGDMTSSSVDLGQSSL
jgi:hypothetical protein